VSGSTVNDTEIKKYQALNNPSQPLDCLTPAKRKQIFQQIYEKIKKVLELPSPQLAPPKEDSREIDEPQETSFQRHQRCRLSRTLPQCHPGSLNRRRVKLTHPYRGEQVISEETGQAREKVISNGLGMKLVLIPAGPFQMGSPSDEAGRYDDERQHQVTISRPYYLQITLVTQGQWQQVMGSNPSYFKEGGQDCPVEQVSWDDAQELIRKLNQMEKTDTYRLPTEAEWEYACRAKSTGRFCFGDDAAKLRDHAWFEENSAKNTHPVGQLQPNAWDLYVMHGNVWEWCQDWYGPYADKPVIDPKGPDSGPSLVLRGGSWGSDARSLRSGKRDQDFFLFNGRDDDIGFRVARTL
jgi:formylglycine-generating enzyme required for sulfatase activity